MVKVTELQEEDNNEKTRHKKKEEADQLFSENRRRIIKTLVMEETTDVSKLATIENEILSLYKQYTDKLSDAEKASGAFAPKTETYQTAEEFKKSDFFKHSSESDKTRMLGDFKPKKIMKFTFKTKEDAEAFIKEVIILLKSKGIKFKVVETASSENVPEQDNDTTTPRPGRRY